MLELCGLSAGYAGHRVLSDLDLNFPAGSFTAVIGPNGSGKSTLLKAVCGLIPCSGQILHRGQALRSLSATERARHISYLPQIRQIPDITVGSLVLHGRFAHLSYPRHYRREDQIIAEEAMRQMDILGLKDRYLPTLSGGERQKAYIATVLAQQAPVLLMDEPTSFLDISHRFEILRTARLLAQQGKTVVAVLHDLELALRCADRILLLSDGRGFLFSSGEEAVQSGLPEAVFQIRIQKMQTDFGVQYFFLPKK